jgi:hypothetical protein
MLSILGAWMKTMKADKPMKVTKALYISYLLRLWRENSGKPPLWRASLEQPQDGERLVFANLGDLFVFLDKKTRSVLPGPVHSEDDMGQPPTTSE